MALPNKLTEYVLWGRQSFELKAAPLSPNVTLQKDIKTNSLEAPLDPKGLVKANRLSTTSEGEGGDGGTGGVKNTVTKAELRIPSITK